MVFPTHNALAIFVACLALLSIGVGADSMLAVTFSSTCLVLLSAAWAATLPLARQARRQRLAFEWRTPRHAVIRGDEWQLRASFYYPGDSPIGLADFRVVLASAWPLQQQAPATLAMAPRSRHSLTLQLRSDRCGRLMLQGLSVSIRGPGDLFRVPLYFPAPRQVRVIPPALRSLTRSTMQRPTASARTGRADLGHQEAHGPHNLRELAGHGVEVRDRQSGDPFQAIAWKASARLGRLLVREEPRQLQPLHWLMVDVRRSHDEGMLTAVGRAARDGLNAGQNVGLCVVGARLLARLDPDTHPTQCQRIVETVVDHLDGVDSDRTDINYRELMVLVRRYLRYQDGIDFVGATRRRHPEARLLRHVHAAMQIRRPGEASRAERSSSSRAARAHSAATSKERLLRRYCLRQGILLPPASPADEGIDGIKEAIRRITRRHDGACHITLVGSVSPQQQKALRHLRQGLRRRGCSLHFNPAAPSSAREDAR